LHEGNFADWPLRWLYFLSGLGGCAMIGTGLVLWASKRQAKAGLATRWITRLNVGVIVGLWPAIAAYFWANRLLPTGLADRSAWEMHALFSTWALLLVHGCIRPHRAAWREQLWLSAAACLLIPVLDALTTDRHLAISLPAGDFVLAAFDATAMVIGLAFAAAAIKVAARPNTVRRSTR